MLAKRIRNRLGPAVNSNISCEAKTYAWVANVSKL